MYNAMIPYFETLGSDSFPDDIGLFHGLTRVTYDNVAYYLTQYDGDKDVETGAHTFEDWKLNGNFSEAPQYWDRVIERVNLVNHLVSQKIAEIEGGESKWKLTRAEDNASIGDFGPMRLIRAQRVEARKQGNALVEELTGTFSLNFDKAKLAIDVSNINTPPVTLITIGSFWKRLLPSEFAVLNSTPQLAQMVMELNCRTYVDIADETVQDELRAIDAAFDVLVDAPVDSQYATRFDELVRFGDNTEAYNITV